MYKPLKQVGVIGQPDDIQLKKINKKGDAREGTEYIKNCFSFILDVLGKITK